MIKRDGNIITYEASGSEIYNNLLKVLYDGIYKEVKKYMEINGAVGFGIKSIHIGVLESGKLGLTIELNACRIKEIEVKIEKE